MTTRHQKLQNAASRLNQEAGQLASSYTKRRGKIIQFHPCAKALVYLAAMQPQNGYRPDALREPGYSDISTESALEEVRNRASLTICSCHNGLSKSDLFDYEF